MYVVMDNTMATMGDLIGFNGYLNTTTPFSVKEHQVQWKTDRRYMDFNIGNTYNETCAYPRFWNETGFPVDDVVNSELQGCYDSDFDQFGDIEAFGVFPDWQRQVECVEICSRSRLMFLSSWPNSLLCKIVCESGYLQSGSGFNAILVS
jgi:alpha-1,3-glucan synthase